MGDPPYTCIWEYQVPSSQESEFLAHYAPDGTWAKLFRRSAGYLSTELYRDRTRPERFITIDHWLTETAFREFGSRFAVEYDAIDRECAPLTSHEASLGEFRPG